MAKRKTTTKKSDAIQLEEMNFKQLFAYLSHSLDSWDVWKTFIYCAAWELAKPCGNKNEHLQEEYDHLFNRLTPKQQRAFGLMLGELILEVNKNPYQDFLGNMYEQLGMSDPNNKKQFFTPIDLSFLMGELTLAGDNVEEEIKKNGYFTLSDDCIGSGSTIIGYVKAMAKKGMNYQQDLLVLGTDLSEIAMLQCYIQLSLLGIPAILCCGNSLTLERKYRLYTNPFVINPLWNFRALTGRVKELSREMVVNEIKPATEKYVELMERQATTAV